MSAAVESGAAITRRQYPLGLALGVLLAYAGFAGVLASAIWTTQVLPPFGMFERYSLGLLGLILVMAGIVGQARLAASLPGKLLCALGAAACLRVGGDPTLEMAFPTLAHNVPMWILNAYPGLATVGWIVAGLGALIWWVAGGSSTAGIYRSVTVVCALVLSIVAMLVHLLLTAAGYEVLRYDAGLLCWRLVEVAVILVVTLSLSGERAMGPAPLILFGIGLLGHVVRTFLGGTPPT
ncbi:MAG: hypothetical protein ACUVX8_17990 [Candidatus Zipacnadales bacterium]